MRPDRALVASALGALPLAALVAALAFDEPWWTRDQQGARLWRDGAYAAAARRFEDPDWRAAALYRDGAFEDAANALSGRTDAAAAYNRGNALVFLGRYAEAVESYDVALAARPGWSAAEENRRIAELRIRADVALGEATELGADDVVFDENARPGGDEVEVTGGDPLGDDALRALWLRNVQTEPADFLRVKFAYPKAREGGG